MRFPIQEPVVMITRSRIAFGAGMLALFFTVGGEAAEEAGPPREYSESAPDAVKESLSARIGAFYDFFQAGKFRDAETIVSEDARDIFYGVKKERILGYDIKNLEFTEDFKLAKVLVTCKTIVPMLGANPLDIPVSSNWRWQDGDWFLYFVPPKTPDGLNETPFGPMNFKNTSNGGAPLPATAVRSIPGLSRKLFRVNRTMLRMSGIRPGEQVITIQSQAEGLLTLSIKNRLPRGVRVELPEPIEKGESGEIRFIYTPGDRPLQDLRQIELLVLPVNQVLKVSIQF